MVDRVTRSRTTRSGKRQGYYVSNRLISGGPDPTEWRMSAVDFERDVTVAIAHHLEERAKRHAILTDIDLAKSHLTYKAVATLPELLRIHGIKVAAPLVRSVALDKHRLRVRMDPAAVS